MAWYILFHRDKNVLIVATKQETAKNMIRIIKNIFRYIPVWIKDLAKIAVDNRNSLELDNGSRVKAITTSADAGRSEAVSLLIVDEAAHIENFEEIWTGIAPTISTGGSVVLMSSPKGTGNTFHRLFEGAHHVGTDEHNGFNCKFGTYTNPNDPNETYDDRFMWWVHPEHDMAWFNQETRDKSPRDIAQEFLCAFNSSGDTFIWHEDIAKLLKGAKEAGIPEVYLHERNVWIWEKPQKTGNYLISCDVSRGDAQDFSAFHVLRLDVHPIVQVAEYKGKIKPDQLGILLMNISMLYNNATIAPENNSGWSGQTILKIEEAGYPFLYYSKKGRNKDGVVDPYYAMGRSEFLPGYAVTSANRLEMLSKMEQYLRLGSVKINSLRFMKEVETFIVNESNRPEAMRGYNDDLIMALAGGLWVKEEIYGFGNYRTDQYTKAMIDALSTNVNTTKDIGAFNINQGASIYHRGIIAEHIEDKMKIKLASGEEESINWLIQKG